MGSSPTGRYADIGRHIADAAKAAPYLTREEERALALRWRRERDEQAMHQLAHAHMRLVIAHAVRFRRYGLSLADLAQEGHIGLLEAAARFEPERDVRFSTYASWWIRASMQDYVLHNWSIVRCGTSSAQKALFFNMRRLRARLSQGEGCADRSDLLLRIAAALGVSRSDVETMEVRLSAPDVSLNAPRNPADGESPDQRIDFLVDDKPLPEAQASLSIDAGRRLDWLNDALTGLSERERCILQERRLADDAATLEALGGRLGISKERVRQIESRALEKVKQALTRRHAGAAGDAMI